MKLRLILLFTLTLLMSYNKEDYELKIKEFQANNPRLPYYIAFGSFVIAILSFINSCNYGKEKLSHKPENKSYKKELTILENNHLAIDTSQLKKPEILKTDSLKDISTD